MYVGEDTLIFFVFLWECKAREEDFCPGETTETKPRRGSSPPVSLPSHVFLFACLDTCLQRNDFGDLNGLMSAGQPFLMLNGRIELSWEGESLPAREPGDLVLRGLQFLSGQPGRQEAGSALDAVAQKLHSRAWHVQAAAGRHFM